MTATTDAAPAVYGAPPVIDPPYQLLPPLTDDEYAALRADIVANGVRVPVDVDEDGDVLDGHHRLAIAAEEGVECPRRVVAGLSADQKVAHALAVNLHRRHLGIEQRRDLVRRLRAQGLSVRRIAETTGVPRSTVERDLSGVPGGTPDRIEGADGKSYPATHERVAGDPLVPKPFTKDEAQEITDRIRAALHQLPEDLACAALTLGLLLDDHPELQDAKSFQDALDIAAAIVIPTAERLREREGEPV